MSCIFRGTYILRWQRGCSAALRYGARFLTFPRQSAVAFPQWAAPLLIPFIGARPPGSPAASAAAAGELSSHSHCPGSFFIHKSRARVVPNRPLRDAPDSPRWTRGGATAEYGGTAAPMGGQCANGLTTYERLETRSADGGESSARIRVHAAWMTTAGGNCSNWRRKPTRARALRAGRETDSATRTRAHTRSSRALLMAVCFHVNYQKHLLLNVILTDFKLIFILFVFFIYFLNMYP